MNTTHQEPLSTAELAGIARGEDRPVDEQRADEQRPEKQHQVASARPLFPENVANDFRTRWDKIQTGFVDEPRQAVQQADELVAQTIKCLAEQFADERTRLERQWDRGDQVNTEDLRVALQTYRSFFQRLLSM